jgi:hypothetical protein
MLVSPSGISNRHFIPLKIPIDIVKVFRVHRYTRAIVAYSDGRVESWCMLTWIMRRQIARVSRPTVVVRLGSVSKVANSYNRISGLSCE